MNLTRRNALIGMGATLSTPYVRPSWAKSGSVNVYNWSDYIGETTIEDFERETGIGVVYDLYSSSEEMQAKMLAGSTGYDVVVMAGLSMPEFIRAGVYQPIDRSRLTGWGNLDPDVLRILDGFDPGHKYGVPYMWGSVGFTFNMAMIREKLPNADLQAMETIFDPANAAILAECGLSILDSPADIGFMVLSWLGIDPSTAGPEDYARMAEAFAKIRPYITTFDNANYLTAIPNGEVCAVNTWSGDYSVAMARAAEAGIEIELAYYVPRTGAPAWFDLLSVPADARNLDAAYLFLDYMLRPEVIAACTNYTGYANANLASRPFVDAAILNDPAIYPDAETLSRMYTPGPQTPEQDRELMRIWAQIKAG